ncbi:MAG: RNA polymerase sigma factor [Firmicutes bacterium]|nr:RNA polymerase sigma factor [Bacillota bacterium]
MRTGISREKIEELVYLYREKLIYFIYRYVKDLDTAEDLAEDVFVEILLHPDRFKEQSSEKTYLFAIGRNKAVDYIRKNSKTVLLSGAGDVSSEDEMDLLMRKGREDVLTLGKIQGDPEAELLKKENAAELLDALQDLRPEYGEALKLRYFEGLSYGEISQILGKDRKQVENLIQRGKKSLKVLLESGGTEV